MWRLQGHSEPRNIDESYPLPKVDDLLASLAGGTVFTKLDLMHTYQQV